MIEIFTAIFFEVPGKHYLVGFATIFNPDHVAFSCRLWPENLPKNAHHFKILTNC